MVKDRNTKLATIHIAKKELGLTDDEYRCLLEGACGVTSASEIESSEDFSKVMNAFKKLGFKNKSKSKANIEFKQTRRGYGANRLTKRQEYYIRGLWDLASRARDEESLRAIIFRTTDKIDISWLTRKEASNVIVALQKICKAEGFNPYHRPL